MISPLELLINLSHEISFVKVMISASILVTFLYLEVAKIFIVQETFALQTLHIGGFFPFTGLSNGSKSSMKGEFIRAAVSMAIEDVEKQKVLPNGYSLQLHANDTKCRMDHASRALFEMINKEPTMIALLGAGCSAVSERIAEDSKTWNLIMVSYGSTSPTLSKKQKYPLFFRTIPSDAACNKARVALLRKFNWLKVGLIGQNDIINSETTADLQEELANADIQILTSETFVDDPTAQVKSLSEKEARIILGNFDEKSARKVLCQAFQNEMYGARYAWLIPGWFSENWWKKHLDEESIECTVEQMNKAVNGYISCDNLKINPDNTTTVSGQSPGQLSSRYQNITKKELSKTDGGFAYDAVWAIALALKKTEEHLRRLNPSQSIVNFTYVNEDIMKQFNSYLNKTQFQGLTGPVQFTSKGDRMGYMKIEQLQDWKERTVSLYLQQNDSILDVPASRFIWQGTGPPPDSARLVCKLMTISPELYGVVCAITVLCIILAVCFLGFNIKLRNYRYIQMSSPRLNNTIVIGCIAMYLSVFMFGLDGNLISPDRYSSNCQARIWLTSLGFTTAFGAMFAKLWRVYVIFTNRKLRKKVIKDGKLFMFVGALLLVDVLTLSVWSGADHLTRRLQNGTIEHGIEYDTLPQWEYCDCQHKAIWFGVLFATKGLLLLFGVFLAWETRHVKIPALNDSRYVGMSVYNVVILSVVGVPAALMIEHAQDASFALTAFFVIFSTTVTLCLVFVPKFIAVKRNPNVLDTSGATNTSASQSSGESSTSQDKGIKGAKFIALAAENSNLKTLVAEKEEEISQLEIRLRRRGVTITELRRISMAARHSDAIPELTPTLLIRGDRDDGGSFHIDKAQSTDDVSDSKSADKPDQEPFSPKKRYSPSSSYVDQGVLLGNDVTKANSAIAKKYSLPTRARKDVSQIETRTRTRSADNEVHEAYENPAIFTETNDESTSVPQRKLSRNNRMESPFYTEPSTTASSPPLPSVKSRYTKPKKGDTPDVHANASPIVKGELQRKGSVVLVSKSQTGETCFQVKTPAEFKPKTEKDKIRKSIEYNV